VEHMTAPMHKHRQRSKPITLGARLAASKNARKRNGDVAPVTLSKEPWTKNREEKTKNAK